MKKACFAWMLICACLLSGCVPLSVNLQRDDQPVSLPAPTARNYEPAVGDSLAGTIESIYLYHLSSDQRQLIPSRRTLIVESGQSALEKAMQALIEEPSSSEVRTVFPQGTQLEDITVSGNVAVVNLSIDARNVESEQQLVWMRSAIALTLTQMDGIEYVQLLIGGENESISGLPMGAAAAGETDMSAVWARVNSETELMNRQMVGGAQTAATNRTAILYYPSRDGKYVVPVAQEVEFSPDDFVTPVVQALMNDPGQYSALQAAVPASKRSPLRKWEIVETESGRRMLRLVFEANLIASLEREGLDAWQLYASLTYTLTGFVPNVDGLIVLIGDGHIGRIERDGQIITFTGGEMNRTMYPDAVGRMADIYLPCTDGGLTCLTRVLDQKGAVSPRSILNELFKGPAEWEESAVRAFPDGVSIDDILGVRVLDNMAFVNLSSNMYRCCQSMSAQQERSLIYAVVNTLTGLKNIAAVQFQVEGETVDTLVSELFLRGPLIRNPGLIISDGSEESTEPTETP